MFSKRKNSGAESDIPIKQEVLGIDAFIHQILIHWRDPLPQTLEELLQQTDQSMQLIFIERGNSQVLVELHNDEEGFGLITVKQQTGDHEIHALQVIHFLVGRNCVENPVDLVIVLGVFVDVKQMGGVHGPGNVLSDLILHFLGEEIVDGLVVLPIQLLFGRRTQGSQ